MEIIEYNKIKIELPVTIDTGLNLIEAGVYTNHENVIHDGNRAWYILSLDKGNTVNQKSFLEFMYFLKNSVADCIHILYGYNPSLVHYNVMMVVTKSDETSTTQVAPDFLLRINKSFTQDEIVLDILNTDNIKSISVYLDHSPND